MEMIIPRDSNLFFMVRLEPQDNSKIIRALLAGRLLTFSSLATATRIPTTTLSRRLSALLEAGVVAFYEPASSYCLSQWLKREKLDFRTASELLSGNEDSGTPLRVFTIGYEGQTPDTFEELLRSNGVKRLVDVRGIANSRKTGFSSTSLKERFSQYGIDYIHLKELGSPKEARMKLRKDNDFESFTARYCSYLEQRRDELNALIELAAEEPTAVMCFERDPSMCHRSIIAAKVQEMGFDVENL